MTQLDADSETMSPHLSDLNETERNRLFAKVQQRMPTGSSEEAIGA